MLVGEMEYEDILERQELETFNGTLTKRNGKDIISGSLNEEYIQTYFIGTTHIMMTAFMFFMSIIVMNLLFGLAVTDVQVNTQKGTKLFESMSLKHLPELVCHLLSFQVFIFSNFERKLHFGKSCNS